jgi:hypothetical protein
MTKPIAGSSVDQDLKQIGPWAPILCLLVLYLVAGLDISLGDAEDDPRIGYAFLGLFAVTASGAFRWRRQPRAIAVFCLGLIAVHLALALLGRAMAAVAFGLPFLVIFGLIFGLLGTAAALFWRLSPR